MNAAEVAQLIQRFLDNANLYPQEWNDFVDTPQRDPDIEAYRKQCYELNPLVNRPGDPDPQALRALHSIIQQLRSKPGPAAPREPPPALK